MDVATLRAKSGADAGRRPRRAVGHGGITLAMRATGLSGRRFSGACGNSTRLGKADRQRGLNAAQNHAEWSKRRRWRIATSDDQKLRALAGGCQAALPQSFVPTVRALSIQQQRRGAGEGGTAIASSIVLTRVGGADSLTAGRSRRVHGLREPVAHIAAHARLPTNASGTAIASRKHIQTTSPRPIEYCIRILSRTFTCLRCLASA